MRRTEEIVQVFESMIGMGLSCAESLMSVLQHANAPRAAIATLLSRRDAVAVAASAVASAAAK